MKFEYTKEEFIIAEKLRLRIIEFVKKYGKRKKVNGKLYLNNTYIGDICTSSVKYFSNDFNYFVWDNELYWDYYDKIYFLVEDKEYPQIRFYSQILDNLLKTNGENKTEVIAAKKLLKIDI